MIKERMGDERGGGEEREREEASKGEERSN